MISRILTILLGLWLMISPTILHFDQEVSDNNHIIGPIIITFSIIAIWECTRNIRFLNFLCSGWLFITPWIFSYSDSIAIVNNITVGIAVMLLALPKQERKNTFGGGWISIFK